jgi:hypothetical protein
MAASTLSLTQPQVMAALRRFLLNALPSNTDVILAQVNRVPEPRRPNFVVMTPLRQARLETNETTYSDNILVGEITGDTLSVTQVERGSLSVGNLLLGTGSGTIQTNTYVLEQLSGSVGGTGVYLVNNPQVVGSGVIYAGERLDLVGAQLTVQLDIHGPNGMSNARVIDTLFRSDYGYTVLQELSSQIAPLYCGDPRQLAFRNSEQQYEDRWVMEVEFEVTPLVSTTQQFADEVEVDIIIADVL